MPERAESVTTLRLTDGETALAELRRIDVGVGVAVLAFAVFAWLGLSPTTWPDWVTEAQPSALALVAGHFGRFLQTAPAYAGSLLLRAPFMLLTRLWHGGELSVYRAGAAPCMAAAAGLAVYLSATMRRRGYGWPARTLAVVLVAANPLAVVAIHFGHPEDVLCATLCVVALVTAQRDRPLTAGLVLGIAVAGKPWGAIAAGPVLLALSSGRGRAIAASLVTVTVLVAPFLLAASGGVAAATSSAGLHTGTLFEPWQLWWFLGAPAANGARTAPVWLGGLGHTLPLLVVAPLTALYARLPDRRRGADLFLLLALLLVLRCGLDPWDTSYYALPFLFALVMWETSTHPGAPVRSLAATLVVWLVFRETQTIANNAAQDLQAAVFAVVAITAIVALALRLYGPAHPARVACRR